MAQKASFWRVQDKKKFPLEAQIVFKWVFKEVEVGQKKFWLKIVPYMVFRGLSLDLRFKKSLDVNNT